MDDDVTPHGLQSSPFRRWLVRWLLPMRIAALIVLVLFVRAIVSTWLGDVSHGR